MKIVSQEQIASAFGVAPKTITRWQAAGFPVSVRGARGIANEYDSAACIAWYLAREVGKVRTESARDRLARVQADSIEMDNAVKRAELIPAADIEPRMRSAVIWARGLLLAIPGRLGADREQRERWEVEAEAFLGRLAQWQNAAANDAACDEESECESS